MVTPPAVVWTEPVLLEPPARNAPPAPRKARTPSRQSQGVQETAALTPRGQHHVVVLERTSTGGTRREAAFKISAHEPMTGAERAMKKRLRASLFPQQQTAARARHAEQERVARPRRKAKAELEAQAIRDELNTELDAEIRATGGYMTCSGCFQPVSQERVERAGAAVGVHL